MANFFPYHFNVTLWPVYKLLHYRKFKFQVCISTDLVPICSWTKAESWSDTRVGKQITNKGKMYYILHLKIIRLCWSTQSPFPTRGYNWSVKWLSLLHYRPHFGQNKEYSFNTGQQNKRTNFENVPLNKNICWMSWWKPIILNHLLCNLRSGSWACKHYQWDINRMQRGKITHAVKMQQLIFASNKSLFPQLQPLFF